MRTSYYESVSRTVDGFVGAISRKEHVITLPARIDALKADATTDGTGVSEFVKKLTGETLLLGRGGVLVDFDEALGRPYFSFYAAESITNWSENHVVLHETVFEPDSADRFVQKEVPQIREVALVEGGCMVTLWRKTESSDIGSTWGIYKTIPPQRRGATLKALPWFWLSPVGMTAEVSKPPLLGLVNVSFSHYRSMADLEHGRHFTAMPTLYITGTSSTDDIEVGGGAVIKLTDAQGKVGYAEFTGQGLKSLEKAIEDKEQQMAVLGAAVFAGGKKGVEAAETARIRTSAENSLLMGIVSSVEESLLAALKFAAAWASADDSGVTVHLNRDFIDEKIDPQTLVGMVQALQANAMSLEAFTYCLDQASMLPPDTNLDDEVAKLKKLSAAKVVAGRVPANTDNQPPAEPEANPGGDK